MISPLSKQQEAVFRKLLSDPMDRINVFPESNDYFGWIGAIADFMDSKGGASAFGVENYRADFEFFTAENEEQCAIIFLTKFAPHELVFFGPDWMIGISSYPDHEDAKTLEYAIRLYGAAQMISRGRLMTHMQFRIEFASQVEGKGYVLARQLAPGDFSLPEHPTLGGIPITRWVSQPRSLGPDGTPDLTIFAFHLASPSDTAKLSVGQLVELSGERA